MNTPICDFVKKYAQSHAVRLHMPGHKGKCGASLDITEIHGADVLYAEEGIIGESQQNAARLFCTAKTVYSAEGSSLSIRAMVYLAALHAKAQGKKPVVFAARNAHKSFVTAAALLGVDVVWLYPENRTLLQCEISPQLLDEALKNAVQKPVAVFITSPDYIGNVADVKGIAAVCRNHGTLLFVDNAHGAYLNFLPQNAHPIALGADVCCDSAHKTLPVLTGGGYLHFAATAPQQLVQAAEGAMALFASTSPSYLVLQSLDAANAYLAADYPKKLIRCVKNVQKLKLQLAERGFSLAGNEPLKVTLAPKSFGYLGSEIAAILRSSGVECEFCDPDYVVMMFTPQNGAKAFERVGSVLLALPKKTAITQTPPPMPKPRQALSPKEAVMSPSREVPVQNSLGKTLAAPTVSCPPAVPIVTCGETIDEDALRAFRYYGITSCKIVL